MHESRMKASIPKLLVKESRPLNFDRTRCAHEMGESHTFESQYTMDSVRTSYFVQRHATELAYPGTSE